MLNKIANLLLKKRIVIVILIHLIFAIMSLVLAFLLRFDLTFGGDVHFRLLKYSLPINVIVFVFFSGLFNLFQGIWRYVSVDDLKEIFKTSAVSSLVFMSIIVISGKFRGYPRSVYLLNFTLFILLNGGTRFTIRIFRESFIPIAENIKNVLIIGAGTAGNEIVKTLKTAKKKEYIPIGFIDRDPEIKGKTIQGIKVLGGLESLRSQIIKNRIREVFIAIPEATNKMVNEIIQNAKIPDWDVKFKIAPSVLDIMSGKLQVNQIRDVSINDLLSRPNITLDDKNVRKKIAGKTIFITGGGGSIGGEIAFQIASYSPARIILLDASEENAYKIDKELKKKHSNVAIHTVVGSILDNAVLDMVMKEFRVDYIFHSAAYKHVHLMEWNPFASLKNNVLGTAIISSVAERNGVKQFVMISTDKAVNPRGMMGVSKRLCERVILERNPSATKFNVVRFGNVLGSSGSVIPLFQQQIREGGPITVTSPETKRFFMSIPEAVQLVIQASTLDESNAIFMLEMGDPVRIIELARNLIELSGLKVNEDIEIKITRMRPGEKIMEELLTADENLLKTPFQKIRVQKNVKNEPEKIENFIHNLKSYVEIGNIKKAYDEINLLIPEMKGPSFEELKRNMFA